MSDNKRHLEDDSLTGGAIVEVKRARTDARGLAISERPKIKEGPKRTSALLAPIMLLTGHADQVLSLEFSPAGDVIASGSHDKSIFLWRTYGECENYMAIHGE
jgi:Prp8 binding protein